MILKPRPYVQHAAVRGGLGARACGGCVLGCLATWMYDLGACCSLTGVLTDTHTRAGVRKGKACRRVPEWDSREVLHDEGVGQQRRSGQERHSDHEVAYR